MMRNDEFYIGYHDGMPAGTRRLVRLFVAIAAVVIVVAASLVVVNQRPLAKSRFDYGYPRQMVGYLQLAPAPALMRYEDGRWIRYWLVSQGKFGPARALGPARDGWVRLSGTAIARELWRMLEVTAGSVQAVPAPGPPPPAAAAAASTRVTLRGEIVDSKCFLGVMNPGERTVHRDCAIRCLAGGIPPMLRFSDDTGTRLALVIADADWLGPLVGRPVTLTGTLTGADTDLVFVIDPGA